MIVDRFGREAIIRLRARGIIAGGLKHLQVIRLEKHEPLENIEPLE
jgi:hypothetical protein